MVVPVLQLVSVCPAIPPGLQEPQAWCPVLSVLAHAHHPKLQVCGSCEVGNRSHTYTRESDGGTTTC